MRWMRESMKVVLALDKAGVARAVCRLTSMLREPFKRSNSKAHGRRQASLSLAESTARLVEHGDEHVAPPPRGGTHEVGGCPRLGTAPRLGA